MRRTSGASWGGAVEFRLAHEEAKAFAGYGAKGSGSQGEQEGAEGSGFGEIGVAEAGLGGCGGFDARVGDDGPVIGRGNVEVEAGFQIGLVEAREGPAGVHGDE